MSLLYQQPSIPLAAEGIYTIPVLLVHYFPYRGGCIDRVVTGDVGSSLVYLRNHTSVTTEQLIRALEQGSMYHGYQQTDATPSLRYKIVYTYEFLEPMPVYKKADVELPMTDYKAIMNRINIEQWVVEKDIKEVWIWGYDGNMLQLWTSNMAGPYGNISNAPSNADDLPVFDRTYTVYHYNYRGGTYNALYNHALQRQAIFYHLNPELYWYNLARSTGYPGYPLNARHKYDHENTLPVWTDAEDWHPEQGGRKQPIDCSRWRCNPLDWLIYWMQNIPGLDNGLTFQEKPLVNWWRFIGEFDVMMENKQNLVAKE